MSNEMLRIAVNRPCGIVLPPPKDPSVVEEEERDGVTLLPGENSVSKAYWDQVKDNPGVRIQCLADVLEDRGPGVAVPLSTKWDEIDVKEAKPLIAAIGDIKRLSEIKKIVKTKALKSLCKQRIEEILDAKEKANK